MKTVTGWEEIPSLEGLMVDWDYEPENALGKRKWSRLQTTDLRSSLDAKDIPIKVVTKNINKNGSVIDISIGGLAIILDTRLAVGQLARIGLYLGRQKVISRVIVRNVSPLKGTYRIGMEFVELEEENIAYIAGLISSQMYSV
jgi:hypothetical protein